MHTQGATSIPLQRSQQKPQEITRVFPQISIMLPDGNAEQQWVGRGGGLCSCAPQELLAPSAR